MTDVRLVVDGNDGTGKSTLVEALRRRGFDAADRGIPTKMTDDRNLRPRDDEYYLILDAPVDECRRRLARAGKDLEERYHTVADLTFYRTRFLEVARELPRATVVDAQGEPEQLLARALAAIRSAGVVPTLSCDRCGAVFGVPGVLDHCGRSWPVGRWAEFVCPVCRRAWILELHDGRVFLGEWDAVPPRELEHTQEVAIPGLAVVIQADGMGVSLAGRQWHVPAVPPAVEQGSVTR